MKSMTKIFALALTAACVAWPVFAASKFDPPRRMIVKDKVATGLGSTIVDQSIRDLRGKLN